MKLENCAKAEAVVGLFGVGSGLLPNERLKDMQNSQDTSYRVVHFVLMCGLSKIRAEEKDVDG